MDILQEAQAYAEADFSEVNQAFVDRLMELCGNLHRATALDLGTGPGDIPVRVLRMRSSWHVVAVDASPPMLGFARKIVSHAGLQDSISLLLADAKRLPFPSHVFDVVFSNSLLHHLNDTASLWAEVKRTGRPGAIVLFRDLTRPATVATARRIVERYAGNATMLLKKEYLRSLLSAYTPEEVRTQLRSAGLTGVKVDIVSDRHLDAWGRL